MVLSSLWGAGLPFLGARQAQGHKHLQRFAGNRGLPSAGVCWAQIFVERGLSGDSIFQGAGVCRGQGFEGDRGLKGTGI